MDRSSRENKGPRRLEDYSAAKQKRVLDKIKICGFDDMAGDRLMMEAGRLAFEIAQLKDDKKVEMEGYNGAIKDLDERMEALRFQRDMLRAPPALVSKGG